MRVSVNGVRLFVEVLGQKLVPHGPRMIERPTIVALHGGPSDHAHMRDMVGPLSDIAQVVLYDHRGMGRSDYGDPALWTMAQWGDDVRGLCDALEIERPIVIGGSFGGFVAQSYAIRHPDHAAKLALIVTGARHDPAWSREGFRRLGGEAAAEAFTGMMAMPNQQTFLAFMQTCRHLYTTRRIVDQDLAARTRWNARLVHDYFAREARSFDFREGLAGVRLPVLIMGGDEDPMMPPVYQDEIESALHNAFVTRIRFVGAGHFLQVDAPEAYFSALHEWVLAPADAGG